VEIALVRCEAGEKVAIISNPYLSSLPKIDSAEMMFSASRSRLLQIVPRIQSFAQLERNYGKEGADVIIDNTQLTIFGGFAPNSTSAEVLSKALGSRTVMSGSVSKGKDNPSQSLQMIERPLMNPDELKSLPKGTFVVMKTGFYPMKVKLKLSDYNSNILDAGVYDGKRYFIPVTFEPQILLSSSSKLSKYLDNEQPDLTYGNIKELSGNINNDDNNQALFSGVEDYKNVFLNLIDENVDFYSQKYDFDSDDFRKSVTSLKELYSSNEKNEDNIVPMLSSNGQIELFALYDEIADIENDNDEPIILNTPNKDGESTGVITDAIFISNNSDNKEKALEFIEYALSEKVQSDFCGANIEEYLPTTSYGSGWEYPVNNESYSKLFDKAKEVKYINNTANISEANFMYAKDYVDNIKSYRLYGLYNYYNTEVIGDIVDKFLSDEIDENKFIKELKSRTEIYLDE